MAQNVLLLSIDGGGVRGKIAATILSLLEQDLQQSIYATFDFFAGTSTGALIVLGITANKYTANEISALYNSQNLEQIFSKNLSSYIPYFGAKYSGKGKRNLFNQLFSNKIFSTITKPTVITAYDFKNNTAVLFKNISDATAKYDPSIAEVADATTAAPTYFPTVVTGENIPRNLIDGGVIANDPSLCLLNEAIASGVALNNIKLLSFGTGYKFSAIKNNINQNWGDLAWIKNGLIDHFMFGNASIIEYQCKILLQDNYLRINGDLGAVDVALDNIAGQNLKHINGLAHNWYQKYKNEILSFLNI